MYTLQRHKKDIGHFRVLLTIEQKKYCPQRTFAGRRNFKASQETMNNIVLNLVFGFGLG